MSKDTDQILEILIRGFSMMVALLKKLKEGD